LFEKTAPAPRKNFLLIPGQQHWGKHCHYLDKKLYIVFGGGAVPATVILISEIFGNLTAILILSRLRLRLRLRRKKIV
ncbi:MAG: hypothetical protein JSV88_11690, partial [Candidatus Aminicenantes bacterium]